MKYGTALLALATVAFGNQIEERGRKPHETTLTTYTTVTTCPVTSTYTKEGSTYYVTELTTSTIVVTECHGCDAQVTTVHGPDVTKTDYDTEYETITSLCPVTETKTVDGKVITVTYTTTEYIKKNGYTTIYETVKKPDETKKVYETDYETITSLCPVTETKTIDGHVTTITYTTTEYIKKNGYTTIYETVKKPDETKKVYETDYETITSLCPVTETKTIDGKVTTITYTTTDYIRKNDYTTIYETVKKPDETKKVYETDFHTITSLCPVTETKVVDGETVTLVYTSTQIIKENAYTTIYETIKKPDETKTAVEVAKSTITSLLPVTETKTVNGEVITKVYTSTEIIVKEIPTTIEAIETIYNTIHGTEVETHYSKVYVTVGGGTVVYTKEAPPNTIVVPQTSVVEVPPVTVTEVEQPPETTVVEVPVNAAQANQAPIVALMAGVFGAIALF